MRLWFLPPVCLECRAKGGDQLEVWGGTKVAHICRECAIRLDYDSYMVSVAQWLWPQ